MRLRRRKFRVVKFSCGKEWEVIDFRDVFSEISVTMARGKRQEARGKRQEARGKRQEARGKRQEARGKRQEARGKSYSYSLLRGSFLFCGSAGALSRSLVFS
jgi:uncharacterized protein YjbJ (UPF0337 family)